MEPRARNAATSERGGVETTGAPRPKTILIVDDQEDERAIQRAMLEHLGYGVDEASDGLVALQRAVETPPDLILLDIAMPRMDGLQVCRALRENPATSEVSVLFYTASPNEEWEEQVAGLGVSGVLVKPVDPHVVATEVRRLIGPPLPGHS